MAQLPWVRIDTDVPQHPKILQLINDGAWRAVAVWHFGLEWCGGNRMAGYIPHYALPMIHARVADANKLVEVGLWHEAEGGWRFHQWADRNLDDVAAQQRSAKAAKAANARWSGKGKRAGHLRQVEER